MDAPRPSWYFSNMDTPEAIPVFTLFGETGHFPDVVHCEAFSARAPLHDWRITAHRHAHIAQLFLIECGHGSATIDGQNYTMKNGNFIYIPTLKVHEFKFHPNIEGQVISLPLNVLSSIGPSSPEIMAALSQTITGRVTSSLRNLANALVAASNSTGHFRAQRTLGLAHSVLGAIAEYALDGNNPETSHDPRLAKLDTLITEHMAESWTASDYADALALSTGHLSRLCRQASGRGAAAYIEHHLMEEACRLLAFTALPVSDIGYRLGYADPSYFSKRFRIVRQQAPTEYRAQFSG